MKRTLPVGLLGWAFVVVIASFIPWGTFQATNTTFSGSPFGGFNPFMGMPLFITMTGWQGNLSLAGVSLPNWLVVVAALGAAALGYVRSAGLGEVNRAACVAPLIYGILHVVLLVLVMSANKGTIGFGAILTIVALVAMLVSLFKKPSPKQVSSS